MMAKRLKITGIATLLILWVLGANGAGLSRLQAGWKRTRKAS
ncbi:MAG: hypothetical protein AAGC99_11390 [Pseudomonadota bacterium]